MQIIGNGSSPVESRQGGDCACGYGIWDCGVSQGSAPAILASSSGDALQSQNAGRSYPKAIVSPCKPWATGIFSRGHTAALRFQGFWLKRAEGKRELRFVVSTHPYSGTYLVRLGRRRWAIEGFFKTIKHRDLLHRFGQTTKLGVYRWLILSLIAYLLAHWIDQWSLPPILDWKAASDLALAVLFPSVLWFQLLRLIRTHTNIAAQHGFEIVLKPISLEAYRECCKI